MNFQDKILYKIRFKVNTSVKFQWMEFYNSCIDELFPARLILFIYSELYVAGRMECPSTRIRTRNMGGNIYRWRKLIQCVRGSTFANERDDPSRSGTRVFPTRPMCEKKRRHPGTSCARFRAADATQGSIYLTLWLSRVAARTRPRTADNSLPLV